MEQTTAPDNLKHSSTDADRSPEPTALTQRAKKRDSEKKRSLREKAASCGILFGMGDDMIRLKVLWSVDQLSMR